MSVSEIRFHLDEHMNHSIVHALRRHGIDISTTNEAGLLGHGDEEHLAHCLTELRVIVTDDYDFLRFAADTGKHAGIAFCHRTELMVGQIINRLILLHGVLTAEEMRGHVEFL